MKVFESEIGKHPFPRSERNIRALVASRSTSFGYNHLKSLVLLKKIQ